LLFNITLATGLLAELGFLGVTILGFLTVPFTWGQFFNAGDVWWAFFFKIYFFKKLNNSWQNKNKNLYKNIWINKI